MPKYNLTKIRECVLVLLTATLFFFQFIPQLFSKENIFVVKSVQIEGTFDINFSREKFIDEAFKQSFNKLLLNILLAEDLEKLKNLNLNQIKNLISSFKILDEKFQNNKYFATFEVLYNDIKIKRLLSEKNILFYDPKNTVVFFFPVLIIENEVIIFNENFFYKHWLKNDFRDKTIKYILPLENLDDILSINEIKNEIESLDFMRIATEYNTQNYAVAIMSYEVDKLKVYLKTNLDSKKYHENLSYELKDWDDKSRLNFVIKDLKLTILNMWKRANLINIPLPLNIFIKFQFDNLKELHNLEKTLNKIHVINIFSLEKFDLKNSFFKINYYGDPKKLSDEFLRFNYLLKDDQGYWELKIND